MDERTGGNDSPAQNAKVQLTVLVGGGIPRMIPFHPILHQCRPLLPVGTEGADGGLKSLQKGATAVIPELESGTFVDGVVQTAGCPNYRDRPIAEAVDLVQPTWLVVARHEEDIRAGLHFVREFVVELHADGRFPGKTLRQAQHQRLVMWISRA